MELTRIFADTFSKEWDKASEDFFGKFCLRAKKPMTQYNDGYGLLYFAPREYFWCHFWKGEHCFFGATELIPDVTVVTGTKDSPMFFSPQAITEKFMFTDRNPFTNRHVPARSAYWKALRDIKEKIKSLAKA